MKTSRHSRIGKLGHGAGGASGAGAATMCGLWGRNADLIEEMKARRANAMYLPDVVLPAVVSPTASLEEALDRADIVVAALPSHGTRAVIRAAAPFVPRQALIVSATKGLEQDTLLRMSEVIAQEVRGARPVAVLSGPSFAMEVARGPADGRVRGVRRSGSGRGRAARVSRARTSGCTRAPMWSASKSAAR